MHKLPSDFSFDADIDSVDNFFDETRGEYIGGQYSLTTYQYQTVESTKATSLIRNLFEVKTYEGDPIVFIERFYGIDRSSGKHISTLGDKEREGYLFAPEHLKKGESFTYWHVNYDGPAEMKYVANEVLYGLHVYHYESNYEGVEIDQTEELSFLPDVGVTRGVRLEPHLELWVEPVSGQLIRYMDDTIAYYYDLETGEKLHPWNHFSNQISEKSTEINVEKAKWKKNKIILLEHGVPLILLFLGLFFLFNSYKNAKKIQNLFHSKRFHFTLNFLMLFSAGLTLLGWTLGNTNLVYFLSTESLMSPITALCFILSSLAFFLSQDRFKQLRACLGVAILLIASLRLASIYGLIDFTPDLILFKERVLAEARPSRMSLFTSITFFLVGLSLLSSAFIKKKQSLRIPEIAAYFILMLSVLGLLGIIFPPLQLSQTSSLFFSASTQTLLLFLLVAFLLLNKFKNPNRVKLNLSSTTIVAISFIIPALITVFLTGFIEQYFGQNISNTFADEADRITDLIDDRFNIYINSLEGGVGLFAASDNVERDEWKYYVDSLNIQQNYPGIQGMGYATFVQPQELPAFIQSIQNEGFPEYAIHPEGEREIYSAVIYLEPFDERNQQAFGYDMFQNPIRRLAMEQARDTGLPKMSAPVTLVQEIDEDVQVGFLIYLPVYNKELPTETLEQRREAILGYVYAPFRANDFIESVIISLADIHLRVDDGVLSEEGSLLYESPGSEQIDWVRPKSELNLKRVLYVGGRPITISFLGEENFGKTILSKVASSFILLVGFIISLLVSLFFSSLLSSREKAIHYAKQVTKDIQKTKARSEAMLLSIGDGLVATNEKGEIIFVNDSFESILGWKKHEVIGKSMTDIIPMRGDDDREIPDAKRLITKVLLTGESQSTKKDLHYLKKDGSSFPVTITVSPIKVGKNVIGAVEVFKDVTQEFLLDKSKTEFVSLASHQLKTPLTAIRWYTEILLSEDEGKLNPQQKEFLKEIFEGNQRMNELVNSLLDISRIEMGTFIIDPKEVDVPKLTHEILKTNKLRARKRKQDFVENYGEIPPMKIDKNLYTMILDNLVSNAIKYTPKEGKVEVKLSTKGKNLMIQVQDNGVGIPRKQQDQVFSKLFRADNVRQMVTDGTGLGMYLVKSLVDLLGGEISFTSKQNKGTTFTILLPLMGMKRKKGSKTLGEADL